MLKIKTLLLSLSIIFCPLTLVADSPDKLIFLFQKQKNPASVKADADKVANYLSKELGIEVQANVPTGYAASVQALVSSKADIAYVDSMAFLLARRDAGAKVLLAEQRVDTLGMARTDYDSVFVVKKDSALSNMEDLIKAAKDTRMVFTSPTSTSGYVMAYRRFVEEKLLEPKQDPKDVFKSVSFAGSYAQAVEQVIAGRGDVCAVSYYAVEGSSAKRYLSAEKLGQVRILSRTSGVPTHVIAARGSLDKSMQDRVTAALLKLSSEQPALLSDVYGASRFVKVDENSHVQTSVDAVKYLDIPVENLVNKKS